MIAMTQEELLRRISTVVPAARRSRIRDTQMRCPRIHGFPKQMPGSIDEILHDYPQLVRDDVLACIAYGSGDE
jgi:uncharacterized protein (DUF433 family)